MVLEPTVWYSRSQAITFMGRTILTKAKVLSMATSMLKMSGRGRGTNHSTMIGDISQRAFSNDTSRLCVETGNMTTATAKDIGIAPTTAVGTAVSKG